VSVSQNPFDPLPPGEGPQVLPPLLPQKKVAEDPPWSGWDVLLVVGVTIAAIVTLPTVVIGLAHLLVFKHRSWMEIARIPEMLLFIQLLMYVVVFIVMYRVLKMRSGRFWASIRWNWPTAWSAFLAGGVIVYFSLAALGAVLPIPKHLPIERFFETAREATIMSVFAVSLAPLMEELFFRGLLYPVLARRLGVGTSIFLTAAAFGLLHGAQLKYSWAVLIIFLVGVVLTAVRAVTKSVAASFLLHVGYNATLTALMLAATGGFRHLEKLNQ
jgi:CAAX protease family protein